MIADADAEAGGEVEREEERGVYEARPVPEALQRERVYADDERAIRPVDTTRAVSRRGRPRGGSFFNSVTFAQTYFLTLGA